ncbi:MAG: hypothetical protein K9N52_07205, partial [Verrucomicrobia bacterium]|nr:hypothetical protein [Verrucomicrobiota bacterium]
DGDAAYYHYGPVGNTARITGSGGSVLNRYVYMPFGEALEMEEGVSNMFRYNGQAGVITDGSGLLHMRARPYSPEVGRFIQRDPVGIAGGLPLYGYVSNDPLQFLDEIGLLEGLNFHNADPDDLQKLDLDVKKDVQTFLDNASQSELETVGGVLYFIDTAIGFIPLAGNIYALESAGIQALRGEYKDALWRLPGAIPLLGNLDKLRKGGKAVRVIVKVGKFAGDKKLDTAYGVFVVTKDKVYSYMNSNQRGSGNSRIVGSRDPNEMVGPSGFGAEGWIQGDILLPYTILFENVSTASAPAQVVYVTQELDENLDLEQFELTAFGFSDNIYDIPAGFRNYQTNVDLRPDMELILKVEARLDVESRVMSWTLTSLDPETMHLPEDPFLGFLPPNTNAPVGEGFVAYNIRGATNTVSGDRINAEAQIVFDVNEPIDTPQVFNTVDRQPPQSRVDELPESSSFVFTVSWTGQDNAGGLRYDIYVSKDRGPYEIWLSNDARTSAEFQGEPGAVYSFYSVATDAVGLTEAAPSSADAETEVITAPPALAVVEYGTDTITIRFVNLVPGEVYSVEQTAGLEAPEWVQEREFTAEAQEMTLEFERPVDTERLFFRLKSIN